MISNSILNSSTSTSPSGSKSMSEMDDYSDVKQLITHNRSSSPSDADDDLFYSSSNGQKVSDCTPFDVAISFQSREAFNSLHSGMSPHGLLHFFV